MGLILRRSDASAVTIAAVECPSVQFDSLDVRALLERVDSTKTEMEELRQHDERHARCPGVSLRRHAPRCAGPCRREEGRHR